MTENENQIIATFALIIPELSESDKSYLLGLGEGMRIKAMEQNNEKKSQQAKQEAAAI